MGCAKLLVVGRKERHGVNPQSYLHPMQPNALCAPQSDCHQVSCQHTLGSDFFFALGFVSNISHPPPPRARQEAIATFVLLDWHHPSTFQNCPWKPGVEAAPHPMGISGVLHGKNNTPQLDLHFFFACFRMPGRSSQVGETAQPALFPS